MLDLDSRQDGCVTIDANRQISASKFRYHSPQRTHPQVARTMSELQPQKEGLKRDWTLTRGALLRLLSWLDGGINSDGHSYLEMRRRLLAYFERRNCSMPDDLADQTLNRVARRLEEEGTIDDVPAKYCYIVARFVFMERLREARKDHALVEKIRRYPAGQPHSEAAADEETAAQEQMLNCLERCTGKLEPQNREIIIRYYTGNERVKIENRRALAASLGISVNAVSIRACRIRDKLEECVKGCVCGG
jgi:DNA-directed RNA polymerase specialized sigma24 family protein